jgi:DEAD/DEAH box helicase
LDLNASVRWHPTPYTAQTTDGQTPFDFSHPFISLFRSHRTMGKGSKQKRKKETVASPRDPADGKESSDRAEIWKKVDVGLSEDALVPGNHYDADEDEDVDAAPNDADDDNDEKVARTKKKGNKKRRRQRQLDPEQDLEAAGGEDMGFFFGLEVISPDAYQLETDPETGIKRFRVLKEPSEENEKSQTKDLTPSAAPIAEPADSKQQSKAKMNRPSADSIAPRESDGVAKEDSATADSSLDVEKEDDDSDAVSRMQLAWLSSTGGVELHPVLCRGLVSLGFWTPTPIQAATLPASILGQRNIVGAAPTGSGKTFSYLLPILQELLESYYEGTNRSDGSRLEQPKNTSERTLRALVLSPTRELAMQIQQACESLVPRSAVVIVGGMAVAKQTRLLDRKPPIVIGTPGRLWDLVRGNCGLREGSFVVGVSATKCIVNEDSSIKQPRHPTADFSMMTLIAFNEMLPVFGRS